jgi:hypothetical protein
MIRADSSRLQVDLSVANDNLKEKLHTYEQLERDLDDVISCTEQHQAVTVINRCSLLDISN